ncbi:MAG: hypothetical protein JXR94_11270 [Candidatus Hydrogenedentes bacterium]|nr:hypothetical protein [Candidatus Hydrogenedentota bacterium]
MLPFFAICATIGCTLMLVQFLLTVLGMGHEGDFDAGGHVGDIHVDVGAGDVHVDAGGADVHVEADHVDHDTAHHGSSWFFGILSFRAMVAAVAFFGLTGVAGITGGLDPYPTVLVAVAAGGAAMVVIAWLMRSLHRLQDEGTVQIENTVGATAVVYLRVPGEKAGAGKVTVCVQNRTMEYRAMTAGDALASGTPVVVKGVLGPDIVEVGPAESEEE